MACDVQHVTKFLSGFKYGKIFEISIQQKFQLNAILETQFSY